METFPEVSGKIRQQGKGSRRCRGVWSLTTRVIVSSSVYSRTILSTGSQCIEVSPS